jgi:TetR/AcrR family fatty acid metabolism transcriptional regulator
MPRASPPGPTATRIRPVGRDPGRRQRILEVAKRHFTERGFLGTRLDDIATEAECAKGAIYLEFDDKRTLLREVLQQSLDGVAARFARDVVALPSPLARLRETLRFAYRQHMAEPLFGRLLRDDPELRLLRDDNDDAWKAGAADRSALIVQWVDEGIRLGEIRADVDRDVVPALLGVLKFIPQHLGLVVATGAIAGDRVLAAVVELFAAGLAAEPRRTAARSRKHGRANKGQRRSRQTD